MTNSTCLLWTHGPEHTIRNAELNHSRCSRKPLNIWFLCDSPRFFMVVSISAHRCSHTAIYHGNPVRLCNLIATNGERQWGREQYQECEQGEKRGVEAQVRGRWLTWQFKCGSYFSTSQSSWHTNIYHILADCRIFTSPVTWHDTIKNILRGAQDKQKWTAMNALWVDDVGNKIRERHFKNKLTVNKFPSFPLPVMMVAV